MLHIFSTSPYQSDFPAFVRTLKEGDEVMLIQDGVLAALANSPKLESLLNVPLSLYVLADDLEARGLVAQISTSATTVSYTDFVALTVKNPQLMTW